MKIQRTHHFLQGVLYQIVPDAIDPDRKKLYKEKEENFK